ncbi:MAG: hypothetical protein HC794_08615 [Nitrospiraceae bacterium]|nr:hypothetical protein [Nitrospiraceae bacterium]
MLISTLFGLTESNTVGLVSALSPICTIAVVIVIAPTEAVTVAAPARPSP